MSKHEIAGINEPQAFVIGGKCSDIDLLTKAIAAEGFTSTKVNVPFTFHSTQLNAILEDFEKALQRVTFHEPRNPIVSLPTCKVISGAKTNILGPTFLRHHARCTVNFVDGINAAKNDNLINDATVWIEIGLHTVCSSFIKANLGPQVLPVPFLRLNDSVWNILLGNLSTLYLSRASIRWAGFQRVFDGCQRVLPIPTYS